MSSSDLSQSIGNASAALGVGNVTFEETLGLLTAGTEITRNSNKVSRALVSVQSRYNQVLDDSSSTGEKLQSWYKKHNISIKDQDGNLRSLYDTLGDVAKQWDTLSDNEKKYFINIQAGANQSQNLASILGNFDTAVAATNTALNSQGSAAKENSRYMDSFQGKLSNLKSAFQAFATKVLNSDAMKKGLDLLTSAFSKLSDDSVSGKIAQTLTKFTLLGGLLAGGIGKYAPVMSSLVSTFTNFGNILGKTAPAATKTAQAVTKMGTAAAKTATTVSKTTTTLTTLGNVGYVAGSAATGFEALASSSAKGATTTATFTKNMAGVSKEASKTANSVSKVTSTVTTLGNVGYVTGGISDGFNSVTKSASESSTMTATFAKNMKGASKEAETATKAAKTATKATGEIAKTASKATRATEGLAAGFTAVGASAGPIAAIILGIVAAIAAIAAINNAANPLTQLNKQADSLENNIDSVKQRIAELESSGGNPVFIQTWKNRLKEFEDQLKQTQELIKRTEITGSPSPEVPTTGGATGGAHGKYEGSTANTLPQQYKDLGQNIQLAQSRRKMIYEMDTGTRSIEEYVSASADLAKAEEYIYGVRDALQEAIDAGYEFTPSMQTMYKAILDYDPSLTLQSAGQKSVAMQASIAAQTKSIVSTVGDAFTKMKNGSLDTIDDIANIGIAWENAGMTTTATLDTMINKLQAGTLTQEEYNTSMSQLVKEVMLNNMSNEQFASMSEETIATLLKQVGVTDATAQAQKLLGEAYQESKDKIIAQEKALEQVDGIYRGVGSTLMETSNFATGFGKELQDASLKGDKAAKSFIQTLQGISKGKIDYIDLDDESISSWVDKLRVAATDGDAYAQQIVDAIDTINAAKIDGNFGDGDGVVEFMEKLKFEASKGKEGAKEYLSTIEEIQKGKYIDITGPNFEPLYNDLKKARDEGDETAKEFLDWYESFDEKDIEIGFKINSEAAWDEEARQQAEYIQKNSPKWSGQVVGAMESGVDSGAVDNAWQKLTQPSDPAKIRQAAEDTANEAVDAWTKAKNILKKLFIGGEGDEGKINTWSELTEGSKKAGDSAKAAGEKAAEGSAGFMQVGDSAKEASGNIVSGVDLMTGKATAVGAVGDNMTKTAEATSKAADSLVEDGQKVADTVDKIGQSAEGTGANTQSIDSLSEAYGLAADNAMTSAEKFEQAAQKIQDSLSVDVGSSFDDLNAKIEALSGGFEVYTGNFDAFVTSFSNFSTQISTISSNLTDFASRINNIGTSIGSVNLEIANMIVSITSNFAGLAINIQTIDSAISDLSTTCVTLGNSIQTALDSAHTSATGLSSSFANLKSQTAGVTETFNSINTVAGKMASSIADFGQAAGDAGQRLAQAFSNASSSLTTVSGSLIGVKGTLVQVNTLVSQVSESMTNLSTSATTVDTSLSSIATSASNAMSGITDGAHNAASALITLTTQSSQSVTHMNSLGTASGNAGTALGTFAANVTTATASLSNAASSMLTIAGSMNSVSMAASQASVNISSIASNLSSAAGSGALLSTSLSIVSGAASSASAGVASLATSASSCGATLSRISSSASKASSAVGKVAGPANRTSGALRKVATAANSASAALRSFAASARSVGNLTLNVGGLTSSLTAIVGKANAAAAALRNLKASASGAASAGSGALSNAQYIDTIHGMATGGTVTKEGTILVGEEGPEIVKLPSGAEVYNNDTTRQLLSKLSTSEKTHWGDFDKNKQPELPKVNNAYADWTKSVTKQYETAKGSYSDLKKSDLEKQAKEISKKIGSGAGLAQAVIDAQNKRTEAFTKQLEEQNKLYSEQIDIMEHRLLLMQKNGATEEEQIAQIRAMQAELHKQAEYYRKLGINENDTIIREIQSSWWSLEGDAQDLFQSIADAATEAAEKAKEEWQNYYEELEEGLQNKTEKYELLFEQVAKDAQRRIDDLNEEKDYWEDYYDEKIKALEEENDKIEDNIKLQELQDELAKARQKKVYVYKDGRFQYADDIDEISEAQKNLESYEREKALEDEKDRLEKLKDEAVKNIEEQINKWEEYKNEWENVVDDYQEEQNRLIIEQEFGINSEKMNWDTRIRNLSNFVSEYKEYMRQLKDAQNMQERIDKGEIFGAGTYEAGKDGKAPKGLKIGDKVVTDGGTFQIIKVNEDGTYESKKISSETRKEYASRGGTYDKVSSATETPKTESSGRTYQVGKNGNAPSGLKVGDNVVTAGGTYRITKVKNDGTYESELVNNITNKDYEGTGARYDPAPSDVSWSESKGTTVSVGNDGKAPRGLKVGDRVTTAGGTYKITKVKSDGTYESELIEKPISQPGQSPGGSQTKRYTGYSSSGGAYNITSQKGIDFIENAKAYATLIGGDGSYWTKNNDGSVTVNQNGNIYTVAGVGKYEKGTEKNTNPGLSLLGEKGPELGVLGSGDGVIPNDLTRNLFAWGALTPDSVLKSLVNNTQSGISMNGVQMSFPNVKNGNDAEDFVKAVINIANQRAYKRR